MAAAAVHAAFRNGRLSRDEATPVRAIAEPGRPDRPALVHPSEVPRRRLGSRAGRCSLVHAIAHIEFNAINLALDAVHRFHAMPRAYYGDWLSVAQDEARHFRLLADRLAELGAAYGDLPAHDGLWEMAVKTAASCLERMALVPRVLEARGLDVTPGMMERLRAAGDAKTADILAVILEEEVRHVEIGTRWFNHCCEGQGIDPEKAFAELFGRHFSGPPRGPLNLGARRRAGFTDRELRWLGESG